MPGYWETSLFRRKAIDLSPTSLSRSLGPVDLTFLGMGATLGAGVYVLTGVVANTEAGPSAIISFIISGVASLMSALCYAEFGARVPRAGSAYVYSYVTVGELVAWTTGWQLLLEYIIGASSVARAWSGYVDTLAGGVISAYMNEHLSGWAVSGLFAAYPDFLAFAMTMLLSVVCALGVRESTMVNNLLTGLNVIVILFVIVAGLFFVDFKSNYRTFAPFGVSGIFSGAATSFYAYVGFDVIATSAEETKNPSRNIPIGIIGSLLLCSACYVGITVVLCAMVSYDQLDPNAPLAKAFGAHGANWAVYIIAVGAVCGLSTSLMTSIFPMPRIIYAIASDGLLPPWLGRVHPRFNTPVIATMLCGLFAAVMALIFDITALADMMSIGTLISYTLVAASVLVLRYRRAGEPRSAAGQVQWGVAREGAGGAGRSGSIGGSSSDPLVDHVLLLAPVSGVGAPRRNAFLSIGPDDVHLFGHVRSHFAAASILLLIYCAGIGVGSVMLVIGQNTPGLSDAAFLGLCIVGAISGAVAVFAVVTLILLPRNEPVGFSFTTPGMPYLPIVSIAVNLYLLASLKWPTWVRFAVWCAIGSAIYFGYGIKHSKEGKGGDALSRALYAEIPTVEAAEETTTDEGSPTPTPNGSRGSDEVHAAAGGKKLVIGMSINQKQGSSRNSRKSEQGTGDIEISGVEPADGLSASATLIKRGTTIGSSHS